MCLGALTPSRLEAEGLGYLIFSAIAQIGEFLDSYAESLGILYDNSSGTIRGQDIFEESVKYSIPLSYLNADTFPEGPCYHPRTLPIPIG